VCIDNDIGGGGGCLLAVGECGLEEFACGLAARRRCIPGSWLCDGDDDCGDGSDELQRVCGRFV